ncbi:unnamed protein product [Allacma fusca]|uniref:Uncharacterized protein n=1 Tax=Allacma fusca TaxID=39272 RepID=A0A8J2NMX2_9HEXA|nr:unnamed protein product [Allacma fusca]
MRFWFIIASIILILAQVGFAQFERFYVCDKNCPIDKCEEEDETEESKVCVNIIEKDPDGELVELPNTCAFDCANKCYEYQLTAMPGPCKYYKPKLSNGRAINILPQEGFAGNGDDGENES